MPPELHTELRRVWDAHPGMQSRREFVGRLRNAGVLFRGRKIREEDVKEWVVHELRFQDYKVHN